MSLFTLDDVSRVADLLDNESWYLVGIDVDARALAVDMLHRMTADGHPAADVSPLRFRGEYGTDALLALVADNELEDEPVAGDIYDSADGLVIVTPHGEWELSDEKVLGLINGLVQMHQLRMTRPWSETDESTILSRGLRRPAELTSELAHIADYHA